MGRFYGKFDYSIDAKGRVNIPAKFRKSLNPDASDTFIICQGPGKCLRAYPQDLWGKYETELASRRETPESLMAKRRILSTASDSTLDAQGRISLTPDQIAIAGIKKEVTLVGQIDYVEIWDTTRYSEALGSPDDFDAVYFQSVAPGFLK